MLTQKIQEKEYVVKKDIKPLQPGLSLQQYEIRPNQPCTITKIKEFSLPFEKRKLVLKPLGHIVSEWLNTHFLELFNYDYTREMETALDLVSEGKKNYQEICFEVWERLNCLTSPGGELAKKTEKNSLNHSSNKLNKIEFKIADAPEEYSLVIGKHGPVLKKVEKATLKETQKESESEKEEKGEKGEKGEKKERKKTSFIPISPERVEWLEYNMDMETLEKGEITLKQLGIDSLIDLQENVKTKKDGKTWLGKYQDCDLYIKKGLYGWYAEWGLEKKTLKGLLGNRPAENIRLEEVISHLEKQENKFMREIEPSISSIRLGGKKNEPYIYIKHPTDKRPAFLSIQGFLSLYPDISIQNCPVKLLQEYILENT
jgi:DNA topoisomerase-1